MTKKLTPTAWFLVVVIVVMGVFFVTSLGYTSIKVRLMPLVMSGLSIVLGVVVLMQEVRPGRSEGLPTDEDGDVVEDEVKKRTPLVAYFRSFAWVAGLIASVLIFGFIITVPIWMTLYLWKHGFSWWKSALQGLVFMVIAYLLFSVVLQVELYQGVVGGLIFGTLGL